MDLIHPPPTFSPDFSPIKADPQDPAHHTSFNHSDQPINLLNFDPTWRNPDFLDSPRSIEACLSLGIEQRELLQKNLGDLKDEYIPPQFHRHSDEYLNLKLQYSEHIRHQKLQKCIQAREKLIEEGQKKEMSYYNPFFDSPKKVDKKRSKSPEQPSVMAWNLDSELKKVEDFRRKQEGRIESYIESENSRLEKRENMYNKILRIQELEEERTTEWHRRREDAKNRSISRDKLRSEFSPEGKKSRHELLEKEFQKIMTKFEESTSDNGNKKGKKRRNRAERLKQKGQATEESVLYSQNKLEFVSHVLTQRRILAEKVYDEKVRENEELKTMTRKKSEEKMKRHKSENQFQSREEGASFFDRWDQDGLSRDQSKIEREVERVLRTAQKEEHERRVRQRREDQEDLREIAGKLLIDQRDNNISRAEDQKQRMRDDSAKRFMFEYIKTEEALESISREERARLFKGVKLDVKLKDKRDKMEKTRIEKRAIFEHKKHLVEEYHKERSSIKLSFMKEKERLEYELRERLMAPLKKKTKLKRCKSSGAYQKNYLNTSGYESRATAYDSRTLRTDTQTQDRTYRLAHNLMSIDSGSEVEFERSFEKDIYDDIIGEYEGLVRPKSASRRANLPLPKALNTIYEKGCNSHIKIPQILKSSSREMRPMLKSQPSERSFRSNTGEAEAVHAEVARVKKDQVKSLVGLLELEIENSTESDRDFEMSAHKVLRFIKGQETEIWKMMKTVNYLDLNPMDKFPESHY